MGILNPLKVEITNYPEESLEPIDAPWHPKHNHFSSRSLTLTREIYIDSSDFSVNPPPKYKRLVLDGYIRLRYGYIIRCDRFEQNEQGRLSSYIAPM